ncbi:uncharacterized protein LOC128200163 [Galleria mellonella]|uniref:Uncharacterized protein LOC128200163 n=1 Tax=Galleria mellonella TaxID=7137 RepID=A0ABM3MAX2_GALME|nr:uncharacterized protein LOC128200163 [Galleria mellonella]
MRPRLVAMHRDVRLAPHVLNTQYTHGVPTRTFVQNICSTNLHGRSKTKVQCIFKRERPGTVVRAFRYFKYSVVCSVSEVQLPRDAVLTMPLCKLEDRDDAINKDNWKRKNTYKAALREANVFAFGI